MSFKEDVTCILCKLILDEPISLPCGCIICNDHLTDTAYTFNNQIKCVQCDKQHEVLRDGFRSSKTAKKLIEQELYLSPEEKQLKQEIETQYKEFKLKFETKLKVYETTRLEYFSKQREAIQIQREKLKTRIDQLSSQLIESIDEKECQVLENLNRKYSNLLDKSQMKINFHNIFTQFRHVTLNHVTISELKLRQELIYSNVNSKIDDSKYWLKDDNVNRIEFMPASHNLNLDSFGHLRDVSKCDENLSQSQIVTNEQAKDLIQLCEFSFDDQWSLIYRASRDGFDANDFHFKCDNHSSTLTLLKAKESKYVFGGYTEVTWESSNQWKCDPTSFIFSLTNKENRPVKMMTTDVDKSIYCSQRYGPTFGGGFDIFIDNNANVSMKSFSNLGWTYEHPEYACKTNEAQSFLAGSYKFQLDEVEVYAKQGKLGIYKKFIIHLTFSSANLKKYGKKSPRTKIGVAH